MMDLDTCVMCEREAAKYTTLGPLCIDHLIEIENLLTKETNGRA